jgi:hypothetical protein
VSGDDAVTLQRVKNFTITITEVVATPEAAAVAASAAAVANDLSLQDLKNIDTPPPAPASPTL